MAPLDELRHEGAHGGDDHSGVPAEEDDAGENEDERERHRAQVVLLERDRLELREKSEAEEERDREPFCETRGIERQTHHRPRYNRERERARDQEA